MDTPRSDARVVLSNGLPLANLLADSLDFADTPRATPPVADLPASVCARPRDVTPLRARITRALQQPPPAREPSTHEKRWLADIEAFRLHNEKVDNSEDLQVHPMFEVMGTLPVHWQALATELRNLRRRSLADRDAPAMCRRAAAFPSDGNMMERLRVDTLAFDGENHRFSHLCMELANVADVIDYLASEMPLPDDEAWHTRWTDAAPLKKLSRELQATRRHFARDVATITDLREQVDAALVDLPARCADTYPLYVIDVFSRPSRRIEVENVTQQTALYRMYCNYSEALTLILHGQVPSVTHGLDKALALVNDFRDAIELE